MQRIAKDNKYGYGQLNRYGPDYAEVQKKVNKYLRGVENACFIVCCSFYMREFVAGI